MRLVLPSSEATVQQMQDRSLHHDVYGLIVDAIHRGELQPGDRITEGEIAGRLGISRSPVREAFARLIHDGLVVQNPRRGTYIAKLAPTDIEEMREVRALIEGYAARQAASRMTPSDASELHELLHALVSAAEEADWVGVVRLNARFHEKVVRLTDNAMLLRMWSMLDPLAWLLPTTVPVGHRHDPKDLLTRHAALIDALVSGDPARAEEAFRGHINVAAERKQERDAAARSEDAVRGHRNPDARDTVINGPRE